MFRHSCGNPIDMLAEHFGFSSFIDLMASMDNVQSLPVKPGQLLSFKLIDKGEKDDYCEIVEPTVVKEEPVIEQRQSRPTNSKSGNVLSHVPFNRVVKRHCVNQTSDSSTSSKPSTKISLAAALNALLNKPPMNNKVSDFQI